MNLQLRSAGRHRSRQRGSDTAAVRWRSAACCLLFFWWLASAQSEEWEPRNTWVFAVGVLCFDDITLHTWPDKGRVDADMIDAYLARGVPADHVVFLKNEQATRARIMEQLAATLKKTGPQDLFVFYYAGHGGRDYRDPARPVSFVTYDVRSTWRLKDLLAAIEENFHGRRVLLTADCCYSGGLAEEARRHGKTGISYGVLTSAQSTSTSTGNWTFTRTLTDLLNGSPLLDLDGDGHISLREAGDYANAEMAFCEGQLATFAVTGSFPADLRMAAVRDGPIQDRVGRRCEGRSDGKWYKVKILRTDGARSFVHWIGFEPSEDSWLAEKDLRFYVPPVVKPGTPVQIEWEKKWYPGRVLRNELGLQLVHYDDYEDIDDEWIAPERLKPQ